MSESGSLTHEEIKRKTWPDENTEIGFGRSSKQLSSMLLPFILASGMTAAGPTGLKGTSKFDYPLKKWRKCLLPECDVTYLGGDNNCCCSKEHFLLLRQRQKAARKEEQKKKG